jgi:hypothetical protein
VVVVVAALGICRERTVCKGRLGTDGGVGLSLEISDPLVLLFEVLGVSCRCAFSLL